MYVHSILRFKGDAGHGRCCTFSPQAELIQIYTEEISLLNLWCMSSYIDLIFESNVLRICIHIHCWCVSICLRLFGDQIRMLVPIVSSVLRTPPRREHDLSANCMLPAICLSRYTCYLNSLYFSAESWSRSKIKHTKLQKPDMRCYREFQTSFSCFQTNASSQLNFLVSFWEVNPKTTNNRNWVVVYFH